MQIAQGLKKGIVRNKNCATCKQFYETLTSANGRLAGLGAWPTGRL